MAARTLEIRGNLENAYADVFTPEAVAALETLAGLDNDRKDVMSARIGRRAGRARHGKGWSVMSCGLPAFLIPIRRRSELAGYFP